MNDLQSILESLEDKEIDAIRYGRLDLLPQIRAEISKIQNQIDENSSGV